MSKKDEYFTTMESQIKKWDAEVDSLRARSDQTSADARAKYDEQLKAMRANRDAAHKKLQEIRTASGTTHFGQGARFPGGHLALSNSRQTDVEAHPG
jgi:hypothetical protein